jgi:hypothetical protein
MSQNNGQRARFHRNRKRRVVLRMRMREVMLALKDKPAVDAAAAPRSARRRAGPALGVK